MKKTVLTALALAAATAAATPVLAQTPYYGGHDRGGRYDNRHDDYRGWQPINLRQRQLDQRIDVGVRNGSLSRREAASLRTQFNQLVRLEANYRRGGLTRWERADLDRRFDRLSAQIRHERRDWNNRRG